MVSWMTEGTFRLVTPALPIQLVSYFLVTVAETREQYVIWAHGPRGISVCCGKGSIILYMSEGWAGMRFSHLKRSGSKGWQGSKADTLLMGLPQWTTSSSQS